MKRFYSLLSFILLSLVGITQAVAQDYEQGTLQTDMANVVGQDVVLYSPGTTHGNDHYLRGTEKFSAQIGDDNIYVFELVDGEQADGQYPVYRLKQKKTGLYYKDPELDADGEGAVTLTADANQAYKFSCLQYEEIPDGEEVTDYRTQVVTKNQNLDEPGFVLARSVFKDGPVFLSGHYAAPHFYPYVDTNVWLIYTVTTLKGQEKLMSYQSYYGQPEDIPHGVNPGQYQQTQWQAYYDAFYDANKLLEGGDPSDAEVDAACAKMKETYEAMKAARMGLTEGYYRIHDNRGTFNYLYSLSQNGNEFFGSGAYTQGEELGAEDAKYIWHVTPAEGLENQYYLENYFTNSCVTAKQSGGFFLLGDKTPIYVTMEGKAVDPSFLIYAYDDAGGQMMYNTSAGKVLKWNDANDVGNCFTFETVDKAVIDQLEEAVKQIALNTRLQNLYDKATKMKQQNDGTLGLVTGASQLSSNAPETTEGSIGALLDMDYATYFHTQWSGTAIADYHYLQADLGQAVSGIKMTYAQRAGRNATTRGNSPVGINCYVTNTPEDEGSWEALGSMELTYTEPVDYANGTVENAAGEATIDFNGNYRYFRFEVTSCTAGESTELNSNGKPFWYLSECHFVALDKLTTNYDVVPAAMRTEFENQLAASSTALENEAATEELINALQKAYDDVVANMPDPSRVLEVVNTAKETLKAAAVGEDLGYYTQAGYDAFQAVVNKVEAEAKPGMTLEGVNNAIAEVNAASEAFAKTLILPAQGEYYFIRSASEKPNWQLNYGYNSKNAPVYSENNAIAGALRFTRQINSYEQEGELTDSIDLYKNVKYLWYVEKSGDGKVVLRNVGTGMYFGYGTKVNAAAVQSVEPVELNFGYSKAGAFTIEIGEGQYANAQLGGAVVAWSDNTDDNGSWSFESASKDMYSDPDYYWTVTPGAYQILTLPVSVEAEENDGVMYTLVGQSDDNKFVLSKLSGTVEAGTPFIFKAHETVEDDYQQPNAYFTLSEGEFSSLDGLYTYGLTPKSVNGLTGTVAEVDTCYKDRAYFNAEGQIRTTGANGKVAISNNSGYFNGTHATGVSTDGAAALIDLPEGAVVNGITDVVVVPEVVDVYNLQGVLVRKNVKAAQAVKGLPTGIYVVAGQKVVVK